MNHYVYKISDPITKEYYIGVRSTKMNIESDSYMGSYISWKPINKDRLIKEVIETFSDRESAQEYEIDLIKTHINNDLNRNYHIPGKGFHTVGIKKVFTEEQRRKISESLKGHDGYWLGKVGPMNGKSHTNKTKEKISSMKRGTKHSLKTRKLMSESHKGIVKDERWRENLSKSLSGKPKSESHIKKLSEVHKIPVLQYTLDGEFIKEWPGQIDVLKELGINHISRVCKGKSKSAGGFIWKYKKQGKLNDKIE